MLLACAACSGCDREAESRAEAKRLIERLQALSDEGTLTQRQTALDALRAMELRQPEHARTRDVCAGAHQQLLAAEAAQTSARKTLDEATQAHASGKGLSPERGHAIAAELERSNEALAAAKNAFPQCEARTLQLTREGR